MRITRVLGTAALLCAALLGTGTARADAPGIETSYQNPVTALPPISAPDTHHCTVTAMQNDFGNTISSPAWSGTLTPPADCAGPWNKVVLTWSGSVQGRQYDRLAGVWIGGAEVLRTSTPEPTAQGISWSLQKDVTEFIPLLRQTQPIAVSLGNVVNSTYTGVYHMKLTLTYYQADHRHPAAHTADQVVPLSASTTDAGWTYLNPGQSSSRTVTLPRNLTHVGMEVYARGGGCDEQWFTSAPDDLAGKYPNYLCGGGPYREVQVSVDGRPAGIAQPYPVVYSGGIVPTLWRPIPAVDQFVTQAYGLDLTPFAGLLVDGKPHTFTVTPYGAADGWTVDSTLFLDTDHHAAQTSGALTKDTLSLSPTVTTTETPGAGDLVDVRVSANRDWTTAGWLDTSSGRIRTTVTQHASYLNTDAISSGGQKQVVAQREQGATVVTTDPQHGRATATRHSWDYPITVDSDVPVFTDGNNYSLSATVHQGRILDDSVLQGDHWRIVDRTHDVVDATGVLARTNGVVTAADGRDSEHWTGTTDTGACFDHLIRAAHGYVTLDRVTGCG
ncbi:peptide-N4-asparagine amidase [Streptacidiphilus jiangxiensis]|uniref:Peptide N-acetyl-beta-D-glucosaminyl asparaginase amidase A n=1 Tax=Streptacidiphilus jiangxiensis TaxID=235985 RepID=A0A1H7X4X4_STRJI|nr:peptide-N4-asparagine amidase [Streptacidiphilus jiangxiensis]SEM28189.1 Peptide N-acetyl-beta-D-glucosaminyl asparaginase amidase A [Streptacidiphilus jiangxiensis]